MSFLDTVKSGLYTVSNFVYDNRSEFALAGGLALLVGGGAYGCYKSYKAHKPIDIYHEVMAEINEKYPEKKDKERAKEVIKARTNLTVSMAKLYAMPIAMSTAGIALVLFSHDIIRKEEMAIITAYNALASQYKESSNTTDTEIVAYISDEEGNVVDTIEQKVPDWNEPSVYSFMFDDRNVNWFKNEDGSPSIDQNITFLQLKEKYLNDQLKVKKRVFVNQVYDQLDLPDEEFTEAGQVVGWNYIPEGNETGDNYISFKLTPLGHNGADGIIVDLNPDGIITPSMPKQTKLDMKLKALKAITEALEEQ